MKPSFFVSGFARSGTSLLTSLLNNSSSVFCAQDTGFMTSAKFAIASMFRDKYPEHIVLPFNRRIDELFPHGNTEVIGFMISRYLDI